MLRLRGRAGRSRRSRRRSPGRRRRARTRARSRRAARASSAASSAAARACPSCRSRSIVIDVTRNMLISGKRPEHRARRRCWKTCSRPAKSWSTRTISTHGTTSSSAIVRGSRRSCESTRAAVAPVRERAHGVLPASTSRRNAVVEVGGAGARAAARRGVEVGEQPALAQEQQAVAARRLVHHVARDEQRRAAVGELVEEVPEVAAQHRVEADGGLVEHEHVGLVEERRRERDARPLAAREPPDEPCRPSSPRPTRSITASTRARGERRGRARSTARFSRTVRSRVDGRRLRHVADPAAQRRRRRPGAPSTRHLARGDDLDADDRRGSASTCRCRSARAGP